MSEARSHVTREGSLRADMDRQQLAIDFIQFFRPYRRKSSNGATRYFDHSRIAWMQPGIIMTKGPDLLWGYPLVQAHLVQAAAKISVSRRLGSGLVNRHVG